MNLKNKKILITGATGGIGNSLVKKFNELGSVILATGTNQDKLDKLKSEFKNIKIKQFKLDEHSKIEEFINTCHTELEGIDVLINNAGINIVSDADKITDESFLQIQEVNVHGPFLLAQAFGKQMVKRNWGRIVNIASIWGVVTRPGRLSYSASKMALLGINKTLAVEWAKNNVLVNAVSPGFTLTELTKTTNTEEELNIIKNKIPQNRLALPEEIASGVLFLSSNLNSYIVGQNLIIDGGYTTI